MTTTLPAELYRKSPLKQHLKKSNQHHLKKKNDGLQILRAIAALLVVHRHAIEVVRLNQPAKSLGSYALDKFGACGVDIFFAISGFILSTVVLRAQPQTPRLAFDFLMRRYIRVLPIYWIASTFFLLLFLKQQQGILTPAWVAESYLLLPSLTCPLRAPLLLFGWTLVFEMFFYYVLSLNLLFGKRAVVLRTISCIVLLVAAGSAIGFKRPLLILIANPMNIEFALGCCIALIYSKLGSRPRLGVALMLAGGLLLASTVFFGYGKIDDAAFTLNGQLSWARVLHWGLPSAILTAGVALSSAQIESSFGKLWVYLGDASYSIYLTSLITLFLVNRFFYLFTGLGPNLNIVLLIVLVTLAGAATYRAIERPVTLFVTEKYQHARAQKTFYPAR
jgi:peptidoglycan/LPS O-acetylase OafA/YrhL